jgi:lipopolysaccharide/colanic/teichoic acid biosynthesis glycosyltransferase
MSRRLYPPLKRLIDLTLVVLTSVFVVPLLLLIALAVRLNLGSPVLFRQERCGRDGRRFQIVKFRTMRNAAGPDGQPLPDSERLTKFGNFLRGTSMDELPELWNVFVGDMAIVGPRPFISEYYPLYTPEQTRRHEVRPGITGWAQVNGRNTISWEDRFALDVWYVDNYSFWLDVKIVFMTVGKVLSRKDLSHAGEATMKKFSGTPPSDAKPDGAQLSHSAATSKSR